MRTVLVLFWCTSVHALEPEDSDGSLRLVWVRDKRLAHHATTICAVLHPGFGGLEIEDVYVVETLAESIRVEVLAAAEIIEARRPFLTTFIAVHGALQVLLVLCSASAFEVR